MAEPGPTAYRWLMISARSLSVPAASGGSGGSQLDGRRSYAGPTAPARCHGCAVPRSSPTRRAQSRRSASTPLNRMAHRGWRLRRDELLDLLMPVGGDLVVND